MAEDGVHTRTYCFGHVSFWRGGAACTDIEDWDRADVFGPHSLGVPSVVARSATELRHLVAFASAIHARGREDLGREIAKLIGVKM